MEATRIFDFLDRAIKLYPKPDFFSKKSQNCWHNVSTQEYYDISHNLAAGFLDLGLKKESKVITICNNRPEWNFIDMALSLANMVHVPIYSTLSTEDYLHIFSHSDAEVICISNTTLLSRIEEAYNKLNIKPLLVLMDIPKEPIEYKYKLLSEVIENGTNNYSKFSAIISDNKANISENELSTIIYTSGTTGTPKGVMLSHKNLVFGTLGHAYKQIKNHNHKMLSFLPLCHIYERTMNYEYQYLGISTYYAESLATIASDLASSKADGFCAVPRVLEQMFTKLEAVSKDLKGVKKSIYKWAFNLGINYSNTNKSPIYRAKLSLADKLIYSKWRDNLGGKEMLVVSGGSAISAKIIRLFNAAKLEIYEGYGMTECSPVIAVNNPSGGINVMGTVGPPMDGTELSFAEDGEILTRGPHIMLGYYKDPEYTKTVIDKDGWFHTGDIGTLVDGKYVKITDRKKEIFKLSAGKYIAPQVIENRLKESPYIENCIVIGSNQKFASAIIIPNKGKTIEIAKSRKIKYNEVSELLNNKIIINRIKREVESVNKTLATHEQIKKERYIFDDWSVDNQMLSQTLKIKRKNVELKYKEIIDSIYKINKESS